MSDEAMKVISCLVRQTGNSTRVNQRRFAMVLTSSAVIVTVCEFTDCRGGGSRSVNHGLSCRSAVFDASSLLLGKEGGKKERIKVVDTSLCVVRREILAVCPPVPFSLTKALKGTLCMDNNPEVFPFSKALMHLCMHSKSGC